jgi:5-methylcytosine-specific restriction endonuclease McrA
LCFQLLYFPKGDSAFTRSAPRPIRHTQLKHKRLATNHPSASGDAAQNPLALRLISDFPVFDAAPSAVQPDIAAPLSRKARGLGQVLLLNASFEPLHVCSWQRAIVLLLKGRAVLIEAEPHVYINQRADLPRPLVIQMKHYVHVPYRRVPLTRQNVFHRDQHQCQYCGKTSMLTLDHVIPKSRGGRETWENMVTACLRCNVSKGNKTPQEAGMPLKHPPRLPNTHALLFEISKQSNGWLAQYWHRWRQYIGDIGF